MAEPLIGAALVRLVAAVERQRAAAAAVHELHPIDVLALAQLHRLGPLTVARLAHVLLLSSSGTSSLVRRLVAAELVERGADASASRTVLRVTGDGRRVLAAAQAPLDGALARAVPELPTGTSATIERFLVRLADAAEADADRAADERASAARVAAAVPLPVRWG